MSKADTHLGPPHAVAEALTTGDAETATGSMVSRLFSTALCTRCDSCGTQDAAGQRAGTAAAGSHQGRTVTSDLVKHRQGPTSSL